MNAFQKQLLLKDNRSMAELSNPDRDGIGQPLPLAKVSVEEFEERCESCRLFDHNACEYGGIDGFCCCADADDDYASTPHPRAYYDDGELLPPE